MVRHDVRALTAALIAVALVSSCGAERAAKPPATHAPSPAAPTTSAVQQFFVQPIPRIVRTALRDQRSLRSYQFRGVIDLDGRHTRVALSVSRAGACTGTTTSGPRRVEIRHARTGGPWLFKVNSAAWPDWAGAPVNSRTAAFVDHWLKVPVREDARQLRACDIRKTWQGFGAVVAHPDSCSKEEDVVAGERVVWIACGSERIWLRSAAPHYIVKIEEQGAQPAKLTFGDFDEPVDVDLPRAEDVIDLTGGVASS